MSHTANPAIFLAKTDFSHLHPIISCFREAALTMCIGSWLLTCCLATWMLATGTKSSFLSNIARDVVVVSFFFLIPDNSVASKQQGLSKILLHFVFVAAVVAGAGTRCRVVQEVEAQQ